ncbi:MAG: phage terminase large subunit family protein [Candidatus Rokuibacteriota bacterium]
MSQWADTYRRLSTKLAAEPGPYRTDRAPYLRDIMDALSVNNPTRKVVFMKSAQVGATEAGNNWLGYIIHWAPAPVMGVWPTVEAAEKVSKQRIEPLIEESPELRKLIPPARSRDSGNTLRIKEFPGGVLALTGANSGVGLRSMPARFAFLDEIDGYPGDVDGEGDPVALVANRLRTFGRFSKMFLVSTPKIAGTSRIEREFLASDQRRFFVPCPHCGEKQWLKFEHLQWEKGKPETVAYACEHCGGLFEERHKTTFLSEGEWRPTSTAADPSVAGFHINGLYSPLGWLSWQQIAQEWEAAQGNDDLLKAFKNTVLGETWQEKGDAPDWKRLADRKEGHLLGTVPQEVLFLTAGVDVQRDRIEVHVWGWGRGLKSWLTDVLIFEGNTSEESVWDKLNGTLGMTWEREDGRMLQLSRLAIDTGDGMTTSMVYAWVRRVADRRVIAIKGMRGFDRSAPVSGPTFVDVNERGKKIKRGLQLWMVSVSVFKSETYRFLRLERPTDDEINAGEEYPDGFIYIPAGTTDEWLKQLTAEQLVTKQNRRTGFKTLEWQQLRDRNEALDCRVYARAAAWRMGVDRWTAADWDNFAGNPVPRQAQAVQPAPAVIQQTNPEFPSGGFIDRRPGNSWLNR